MPQPMNTLEMLDDQFSPSVDEVFDSALAEHPEFGQEDETRVRGVIVESLGQISTLENVARQPIHISAEEADSIETIWVFSGTGSYDSQFKSEDNPRLKLSPWMGGSDRARLSRAALLSRKFAEIRSGQEVEPGPIDDIETRIDQTRQLISEYGPTIVYSGYPVETANVDALLKRDRIIIPLSKAKIIRADVKTTTDQVKTFEYPDIPGADQKQVALVSHAPHLGARILRILNRYDPLTKEAAPYLSPIVTPDVGRRQAALMEARGLLWYIYGTRDATEAAHPYRILGTPWDTEV